MAVVLFIAQLVGFGLIVAGVAVWSVPAALIVAGVELLVLVALAARNASVDSAGASSGADRAVS